MKNKYVKWLAGGFLGLMTVFGLGSCTDDHFDINSTNASGTLWENVVATGECNDFTNILTKAIVNKKAYGVPASLTYAELLKTDKTLTVWAPKDGTYDAQQWLDMLDEAKRLEESGDIAGAADKYKTVEKQFVQNHLSYFDYNGSYPVSKRIALANGKYADYDVPGNTIKGVDITSGEYKNIPSTNGTVHLLNSYIPYAYDLKEVLAVYPEISDLYQYVISKDTLMFDERASTEGSIVDGEMQFVDSVFIEANKVMPLVATDADSLTAAIYFTNNAWRGALEHTKKFFTYKKAYSYLDEKGTLYTDSIDADSMQQAVATIALFNNMYYSLNEQPAFDAKNASVESVKNFFETADSLVSVGYYFAGSKYHQHAPLCRTLTDGQTPIEASNGYVFIVDNFNFKANKAWQFDIDYEVAGGYIVNSQYSKSLSTASPTGVRYIVSEGTRNNKIVGKLSNDAYQEFVPSSSAANPVVTFNLTNVLSGTYDIYAVFVPENITDSLNLSPKANKFTATLTYDFDEKGKQLTVNSTGGNNGTFTTDVTKIDTIKLFEDYKFDVCYYGISKSNPMLTITSAIKLADRKTCTPNLRIDCILLVAKDE